VQIAAAGIVAVRDAGIAKTQRLDAKSRTRGRKTGRHERWLGAL
jgi:hypothetical protein